MGVLLLIHPKWQHHLHNTQRKLPLHNLKHTVLVLLYTWHHHELVLVPDRPVLHQTAVMDCLHVVATWGWLLPAVINSIRLGEGDLHLHSILINHCVIITSHTPAASSSSIPGNDLAPHPVVLEQLVNGLNGHTLGLRDQEVGEDDHEQQPTCNSQDITNAAVNIHRAQVRCQERAAIQKGSKHHHTPHALCFTHCVPQLDNSCQSSHINLLLAQQLNPCWSEIVFTACQSTLCHNHASHRC